LDRISTGIKSLDYILHGGLLTGSSILIMGNPGTGKTILANQIIYNNACLNHNVLYLTTISEPQNKIMKFQQEFTYFNIDKFQQSVFYYDMSGILRKEGTAKVLTFIDGLLQKHQPKIVVIDTIKALADMITSKPDFREFISDISLKLTVWDCTSLFLGEYTEEEIGTRPESAIADGIIYLSGIEEKKYQKRFMRILKMRGTSYQQGEIFFKITNDGFILFPRMNPEVCDDQKYDRDFTKRLSTGIDALDGMLGGGIPKGTVTLVSGGAGTGKTLLSAYFACQGLKAGETVVYATFEENPEQFVNSAISIGLDFRPYLASGQITLIHISPVELDMDEHVYFIQEYIREIKASRLVIDSISSFELGLLDKVKYTDYIWSLANYLKVLGVTTIMTHEIHQSFQVSELTKHGISFVADTLILLLYKDTELEIKRYLRIVKSRSTHHEMALREYRITSSGISIISNS